MLAGAWWTALAIVAGCGGGGTTNETESSDASTRPDVATAGDGSSGGGDDASSDATVTPPENDASTLGTADASDAAPGDGGAEAAVDAGAYCTPATFPADCPILPCQTVSGCVQNACTYTTLTVCPAGPVSGTFLSGGVDETLGGVTLHGNIGAFRPADGTVCVGTSCITGDIGP
jgi:hypothetical protein